MPKKTRKIKSKNYIRKRNNASKKGGMLRKASKLVGFGSSGSKTKSPDNESKINECVIVENMLVEKDNDILGYVQSVGETDVQIIGNTQKYNKSEIKSYQYQDILSLLSNIIAHVVKKPYITKGDVPADDIKKIDDIKNHLNDVVKLFGNPAVEESVLNPMHVAEENPAAQENPVEEADLLGLGTSRTLPPPRDLLSSPRRPSGVDSGILPQTNEIV